MHMHLIVLAGIASICSAGFEFDGTYDSDSWMRIFSPIREYKGNCGKYCLDSRPIGEGGGALWKKGMFGCKKMAYWIDNQSGAKRYWRCGCDQCQRDCSFSELYDPRGCTLEPLVPRKLSVLGKVFDVLGSVFKGASQIVALVPNYGPWIAPVINFIGDIFHAIAMPEKNKVIDKIAADINRRTDELMQCFDQKVSQLKPKLYDFSIREAFSSYQIALDTDDRDSDIKESVTHDAWASHIKVIESKFLKVDDDALFLYTMFMSGVVNDFSSTFLLISIDYLKFLKMSAHPDYNTIYKKTMDGFDTLYAYVKKAKWQVVEDWTQQMHKLPCRNGKTLDDELKSWENGFNPEYLDPINEYKDAIDKIFVSGIPGIEEGSSGSSGGFATGLIAPADSSTISCSVDVLSVDHKSGTKGKYFNFDKKELDAILGRSDWSNERLAVSNGKHVKVWRNANGGSKGDAHGRWDVSAKENQWAVGDKITFSDC